MTPSKSPRRSEDTARPDTGDFYLPGGPRGCLVSHGLTGTPYEMRFLGEQMNAAGFTVCGVALAGHNTSIAELERSRWQDWYESVERGVERLRRDCDRVVVAGLSLGSVLALHLARQRPQSVDALALLSTPLILGNPWPQRLPSAIHSVVRWLPARWRHLPKRSEIADPEALAIHPGYPAMPLPAVAEFLALVRRVRPELGAIRQPVLIIQAHQDPTAPMANLDLLSLELPNVIKTVRLERSRHVITVDYEKDIVAAEVRTFAEAVL